MFFAEASVVIDLRTVASRSPMMSGNVPLDDQGIARIAAHSFTSPRAADIRQTVRNHHFLRHISR